MKKTFFNSPYAYFPALAVLLALGLTLTSPLVQSRSLNMGFASSLYFLHQDLMSSAQEQLAISIQGKQASTGVLYSQIKRGFPLDFFLAANTVHPEQYYTEHPERVCAKKDFALGQLAIIGTHTRPSHEQWHHAKRIIIANPKLAPYGSAAQHWLNTQSFKGQLILAHSALNVLHLHSAADQSTLAITSAALATQQSKPFFIIPVQEYPTIRHTMLWLKQNHACDATAELFWKFLTTKAAQTLIKKHQFLLP